MHTTESSSVVVTILVWFLMWDLGVRLSTKKLEDSRLVINFKGKSQILLRIHWNFKTLNAEKCTKQELPPLKGKLYLSAKCILAGKLFSDVSLTCPKYYLNCTIGCLLLLQLSKIWNFSSYHFGEWFSIAYRTVDVAHWKHFGHIHRWSSFNRCWRLLPGALVLHFSGLRALKKYITWTKPLTLLDSSRGETGGGEEEWSQQHIIFHTHISKVVGIDTNKFWSAPLY